MDRNLANELKRLRDERQKKFNEEDWTGALEIHDKILELSPTALRYANRGSILYRLGRLEEAIQSYRKALEMEPGLKRARADLERLEGQLQKEGKSTGPAPKIMQTTKAPQKAEIESEQAQPDYISDDGQQMEINELRDEREKKMQAQDWLGALECHNKILEIEPTALRYANQGSILYRLNRIREAIESYKKALEMDPSLERARMDLEKLESLVEEEHLLEGDKKKDEEFQKKADELRKRRQEKVQAGDWEGALKIHDELLQFDPSAFRYVNRGALLYRLGRFEEALASYRKALELDPNLVKAKEDMANLKAQMDEEALLPQPKGEDALSPEERTAKIARLREERQKYMDAKDWQKALDLNEELIKLDPTALRYVNQGSMYYRLGNLEKAIESYRIALEMDPNQGRAQSDLARLEEELARRKVQQKAEAEKKAEEAPAVKPEDVEAKLEELRIKRQALIDAEKWGEALVVQDQMIALDPRSANRYASRGSLLYRLGRVDEAILSYGKALDLDKNLEKAKEDLAKIKETEMDHLRQRRQEKMQAEDWEGTLQIHDVIMVLEPSALRSANRGSILYRMGRLKEAAESYRKALELDPKLENAREDLRQIEEEMRQAPRVAVPTEFEEDEEESLPEIPATAMEEEIIEEIEEEEVEPKPSPEKAKLCLATLSGHEGEILQLRLTPDEKLLVSASKDKTIKIWDINDYKCLQTLQGHQDWIRTLSITNNGEKIVSGSDDWSVKVWDIRTGKCEQTFSGHTMPVIATCVSKNDRFVLSGSRDCTLKIWDLKSGKLQNSLSGHEDWLSCISIVPEGNKAISASYDRTVRIWNVLGWRCMQTLKGHEGWVEKLLVTPDGRHIVTASRDCTIRIWEIGGAEQGRVLKEHNEPITDIEMSMDGSLLVSVGKDGYLWDLPTGENRARLQGDSARLEKAVITSDKCFVVAAGSDGKMWLWNIKGEPKIVASWVEPAPVCCFALLERDKALISGDHQGTIKIWKPFN